MWVLPAEFAPTDGSYALLSIVAIMQRLNEHSVLIEAMIYPRRVLQACLTVFTAPFSSALKCNRCPTQTCVDCGGPDKESKGQVGALGNRTTWCCSSGALFPIWILLCNFDQEYSKAKQREVTTKGTSMTTSGGGVGTAAPSGGLTSGVANFHGQDKF
jgi:hypothetical protein